MPTYEVSAPDGKKFRVNAPEGATQEEAIAYVQKQFYVPQQVDMPEPSKGFGRKLTDEIKDIPRQLGLTTRYLIEGPAGAASVFTEPVRQAMNLIPGVNIPTIESSAKSVADMIGLPTPQNKMERIVAEPSKLLAGGGALIGGARVAASAPGMVGKVAGLLAENPALQAQSSIGAGAAGGYVKETGGDPLSQAVASVAGGVGLPVGINAVRGIPQAAKRAVEFLAPGVSKPSEAGQVDIVINRMLERNGMKVSDLSASVRNQLRSDVAQAMKTGGNLDPSALRRLADYRMVGATPTRAVLTLDPSDVSRQKNAAKFGINSADPKLQQLGKIENDNNRILIESLNELGAGSGDSIGTAKAVMGKLSALDDSAKANINSAYDAARASGGRSATIDPSAFTQRANDLLDANLVGGALPSDVRNHLNSIAAGKTPLTVDVAEQLKTVIGNLQRGSNDGNTRKALGLVRQALDDAPLLEGQGQGAIDAFNNARSLNRKYMSVVERVPALQAVREGVEPDKFVNDYIIGNGSKASVMDVAKLKTLIKDDPGAMDAVRGQLLAHIKMKALNGAHDEVGNFSQSGYRNALNAIGERKLKLFFSNDEVEKIKAIGRVASYEQVQPRGSAVNNSNTAGAAMATLFDKLANSPLVGKLPMGPQLVGNISASIGARRALNIPKSVVVRPDGQTFEPYILPFLAGSGLLSK